MYTDTLITG